MGKEDEQGKKGCLRCDSIDADVFPSVFDCCSFGHADDGVLNGKSSQSLQGGLIREGKSRDGASEGR